MSRAPYPRPRRIQDHSRTGSLPVPASILARAVVAVETRSTPPAPTSRDLRRELARLLNSTWTEVIEALKPHMPLFEAALWVTADQAITERATRRDIDRLIESAIAYRNAGVRIITAVGWWHLLDDHELAIDYARLGHRPSDLLDLFAHDFRPGLRRRQLTTGDRQLLREFHGYLAGGIPIRRVRWYRELEISAEIAIAEHEPTDIDGYLDSTLQMLIALEQTPVAASDYQ